MRAFVEVLEVDYFWSSWSTVSHLIINRSPSGSTFDFFWLTFSFKIWIVNRDKLINSSVILLWKGILVKHKVTKQMCKAHCLVAAINLTNETKATVVNGKDNRCLRSQKCHNIVTTKSKFWTPHSQSNIYYKPLSLKSVLHTRVHLCFSTTELTRWDLSVRSVTPKLRKHNSKRMRLWLVLLQESRFLLKIWSRNFEPLLRKLIYRRRVKMKKYKNCHRKFTSFVKKWFKRQKKRMKIY